VSGRPQLAVALSTLFVLAGCEGESRSDVACVFGDDHRVASARGGFTAVRIARLDDGFVAAWTSGEGTFVRAIDGSGAPSSGARRVGGHCDAGLDITSTPSGLAIACLHAPIPDQDKQGLVSLIQTDADGQVAMRRTFGDVGSGSRGVSVASAGDRLAVAYFDGELGSVRFAEVGDEPKPEPRTVSREGPTAGPPHLFVDGDRLLLTWAETIIDPMSDSLVGEVVISDLEGEPARFASVLYDDAQPRITRDGQGLIVGYRDENPAGSRVGLFVARVGADLEQEGEVWRVGRSDAASGVSLFPCADGLYAVAPHSYSRREMLIGVSRLDEHLDSIAGERQIYTSGERYEHGTGTCADGAALILVAERGQTPAEEAELKAMTLRCDR
jgi:hypothetical protein